MTVMCGATASWWIAVAQRTPAALTGSHTTGASAAVPQLILAVALMLPAAGISCLGARHATRSLPGLRVPPQ